MPFWHASSFGVGRKTWNIVFLCEKLRQHRYSNLTLLFSFFVDFKEQRISTFLCE